MSDQRDILTILRDPGYIGQQAIFARAADEIERLKAAERNYQAAHDLQHAEIERLKAALIRNSEWRDENIRVWAEVERLKAAIKEAMAMCDPRVTKQFHIGSILRAALEGKT